MSKEARLKNLIPLNQRTIEKRKEIAIKGAKRSIEVRKEKKRIRQDIENKLNEIVLIDKGIAQTRQEFLIDRLFNILEKETNPVILLKAIEVLNNFQNDYKYKYNLERKKEIRKSKIIRYLNNFIIEKDIKNLTQEEYKQLKEEIVEFTAELIEKYYNIDMMEEIPEEKEEEAKNRLEKIIIEVIEGKTNQEMQKELQDKIKDRIIYYNFLKIINDTEEE